MISHCSLEAIVGLTVNQIVKYVINFIVVDKGDDDNNRLGFDMSS